MELMDHQEQFGMHVNPCGLNLEQERATCEFKLHVTKLICNFQSRSPWCQDFAMNV